MAAKKKGTPPRPKPRVKAKRAHDYLECRDYLQAKYGYDEQDYGRRAGWQDEVLGEICRRHGVDRRKWGAVPFKDMVGPDARVYREWEEARKKQPPYLDFWHWVVETYDIHNGCYITFTRDTLDELEETARKDPGKAWVRDIYKRYIDEFADKNGELELYVWW